VDKYLLPERLAQIRKQRGLSQYELADALGFSRGQIGNYEQGTRRPDPTTLQQIADYLHVSVDYLLGRDEADSGNSEAEDPELEVLFRNLKELDANDRAIIMAIARERKRQREQNNK
jgi:transcriptional regulator with XRE-family HTH domain